VTNMAEEKDEEQSQAEEEEEVKEEKEKEKKSKKSRSRSRSRSKSKDKRRSSKKDSKRSRSRDRSSRRSSKRDSRRDERRDSRRDERRDSRRDSGRRRSRSRSRSRDKRRDDAPGGGGGNGGSYRSRQYPSRSRSLGSRMKKRRSGFSGDKKDDDDSGGNITLQIQQMLAQKHAVTFSAETADISRKARRLFLGNLPEGMGLTTTQVTDFFNMACQASGITILPGSPVIDSWISPEGKYGFAEFRCIDECTAAIALNGISLQGRQLVIKRPNDYEPAPDHIPTGVALVGQSHTGIAQPQMNALAPGGMPAIAGIPGMPAGVTSIPGIPGMGPGEPAEEPPSTVLVMSNMVTLDELKSDEDFEDVLLDTKEECEKFGVVVSVKIPRPSGDGTAVPGLGKVFVLFNSKEAAASTRDALHGRLFDNRTVEVTYMDEGKFLTGDLTGH